MAEAILKFEKVSKTYDISGGFLKRSGKLRAVDAVSFEIQQGESLGLVGESGCGKSTLGRLACGLLTPNQGSILYAGKILPPAGAKSWVAGQIQMVFQDPASSLNPRLSVLTSIAEPLLIKGMRKQDAFARANEILVILGLAGFGNRYPHQFSGGQKQRIAIGRAFITHPALIVCDEPVSALDASVQAQILNLLKDIQAQYGMAYLFISHDLAVVGFMCARILVMYLGQLVEKGMREDIFNHPGHPYTQALFAAVPGGEKVWSKGHDLHDLPPLMPGDGSGAHLGSACRFYPRCYKRKEICFNTPPAWTSLGNEWQVRCHFPNKS